MLGVHALIGIGEALITVMALSFIMQTRPDLLDETAIRSRGGLGWAVTGLVIALAVVLFSPFASGDPDGLERVAENLGFINQGASAPYEILPEYTIPFLGPSGFSTIVAGLIGALIVAGIVIAIGRSLRGPAASTPKTG
jgi:cobalt/nickel transport system permease protein